MDLDQMPFKLCLNNALVTFTSVPSRFLPVIIYTSVMMSYVVV